MALKSFTSSSYTSIYGCTSIFIEKMDEYNKGEQISMGAMVPKRGKGKREGRSSYSKKAYTYIVCKKMQAQRL